MEVKPTLVTEAHLDLIISGLKADDWATLSDSKTSFYYCRKDIRESYEMEDLWAILYEGVPVSFLAGNPITSCIKILNTKKKFENWGYGTKLVEFYISLARQRRAPLLWLECRPRWSVPFWQSRKFQLYDDYFKTSNNNQNAILPLFNEEFLMDSTLIKIRILLFSKKIHRGKQPFQEFNVLGYRNSKLSIDLTSPLIFYFHLGSCGRTISVGVSINEEVNFLQKISSEASFSYGFVKHNSETYSISRINSVQ